GARASASRHVPCALFAASRDTKVPSIPSSNSFNRLASGLIASEEITMQHLTRPRRAVMFRTGIIVFSVAVDLVLALSFTRAERVAPLVSAASVVGVPSSAAADAAEHDTSIRPFHFRASDDALADLRRRVVATNFPERELVTDARQGVQLATMQKLARY